MRWQIHKQRVAHGRLRGSFSRGSATGGECVSVSVAESICVFLEEMEEHEHSARRASMHIRAEKRQLCVDRAAEAGSSSWAAGDERATPGSDRSPIDRVPCCRLILPREGKLQKQATLSSSSSTITCARERRTRS